MIELFVKKVMFVSFPKRLKSGYMKNFVAFGRMRIFTGVDFQL